MADGEQRANNCATAEFGYDSGRKAFALVGCANFPNSRDTIPHSTVRVNSDGESKDEGTLCRESATLLSDTCMRCIKFRAGVPLVHPYKLLIEGTDSIGQGTDGEYYGGVHQEWTDAIPTLEAQEAMQQMGA